MKTKFYKDVITKIIYSREDIGKEIYSYVDHGTFPMLSDFIEACLEKNGGNLLEITEKDLYYSDEEFYELDKYSFWDNANKETAAPLRLRKNRKMTAAQKNQYYKKIMKIFQKNY